MKRFFMPVEKDCSAKKPTLAVAAEKERGTGNASESMEGLSDDKDPLRFITWNANGFLLRAKDNWHEFSKFVTSKDPDVIAIQEVRVPAAGVKGLKFPSKLKDDTNSARNEKQILVNALCLPPFSNYHVWWSLSEAKYAGTALLVKKCFQPVNISFSLDNTVSKHEQDGRVILVEFKNFYLLNTYVPNNGWKEEVNSFQRRRKWDKRMLDFVVQLPSKPLIWCGDLNVSLEEMDVSHPEFFAAVKLIGYTPPNKEDSGQPGFTLAERTRFRRILKEGRLVDAYRFLHAKKDMEHGFSWCGNPISKYRGRRMRIDYFLLSEKLKDRILSCEMHGHGIEMQGFYGSDHCPVSLELLPDSLDSIVR